MMNTQLRSFNTYVIANTDLLIGDKTTIHYEKDIILERYFNDIYTLFLNKLTGLAMGERLTKDEHDRMKTLLDEIIKVRGLLEAQKGGKAKEE